MVLLVALLLAVFAPLSAGYNFLPFDGYPAYCDGMLAASGQTLGREKEGKQKELEFGWFAINIPNDVYFSDSVKRGTFPIWNPYYGCGTPTFGDGQFRPMNPFKFLFLVRPNYWTYSVSLFLTLVAGALFFNSWLKSRGLGALSSLVGSVVFSLNPWTLSRLVQSDSPAYLLSPLLFIVFDRLDLSRPFRSACFLSMALLLICSVSHPEMFLLVSLAGFLYYLSNGSTARKIRFVAKASPLFFGATCIYWLPPIIFSFNAFIYKNIIRYDYSYSLKDMLTSSSDMFLFPTLFFFIAAGLFGKRNILFFKLVFAAALLLLFFKIPFLDFSLASAVNRHFFIQAYYFKPFFWLAVSVAAASGFESFFNNTLSKGVKFFAAFVLIASACLQALLCLTSGHPLPAGIQTPVLAMVIIVSTAILIIDKGMLRPSLKVLTAILTILPFLLPFSTESLRWNNAKMKLPDILWKCQDNLLENRVVSIGFRPTYYLPPNWGSAFAIRQGEAVSALFQVDYFKLFHQGKFPFTTVVFDYPETVIFEQMGASFVLVPSKASPLGGSTSFPGYVKEASDDHITIYRLENGKGRFFLAEKAEFESPGRNISQQIMDLGERKDGFVVVRREGDGSPDSLGKISSSGKIEVMIDEPEKIALETDCQDKALLVVRDTFNSDWKARVNGRSADILRVNGCFRGLLLEKGTSKVELYYRPWTTIAALLISLLSCLACIAGLAPSIAARRKKLQADTST